MATLTAINMGYGLIRVTPALKARLGTEHGHRIRTEAVAGAWEASWPWPPKRPKGGCNMSFAPQNTTWALLKHDGLFVPEGPKKVVVY